MKEIIDNNYDINDYREGRGGGEEEGARADQVSSCTNLHNQGSGGFENLLTGEIKRFSVLQ